MASPSFLMGALRHHSVTSDISATEIHHGLPWTFFDNADAKKLFMHQVDDFKMIA